MDPTIPWYLPVLSVLYGIGALAYSVWVRRGRSRSARVSALPDNDEGSLDESMRFTLVPGSGIAAVVLAIALWTGRRDLMPFVVLPLLVGLLLALIPANVNPVSPAWAKRRYRTHDDREHDPMWRALRKGVADHLRRATEPELLLFSTPDLAVSVVTGDEPGGRVTLLGYVDPIPLRWYREAGFSPRGHDRHGATPEEVAEATVVALGCITSGRDPIRVEAGRVADAGSTYPDVLRRQLATGVPHDVSQLQRLAAQVSGGRIGTGDADTATRA